jgi:Cu-Zn family superoxide dismutase
MRFAAAALLFAGLAACSPAKKAAKDETRAVPEIAPAGWAERSAVLADNAGATVGEVHFRSAPTGVLMRIRVSGLAPGWHGIHFHQVGTCADAGEGFKASGPHVDPDGHEHGLLQADGAERGDLPNIYAARDGVATAEIFRWGVALQPSEAAVAGGAHPLLDDDGFAVIVHANADDQTTQPIGGAGDRIACAALTD